MDFNQVRFFLELAKTLNFTRAAERCYVTQPALTQSIKRLEDELGGELITRTGRDTELTELGKCMLNQFEAIDHSRKIIKTTAKAIISGEVAKLNIGIMCTIGPRVLSRLLDKFQKDNPLISLVLHDVSPHSIADKLMSGEIDGAFCARHTDPQPQLHYSSLFEENMVVAFGFGHSFSSLDEIPLRFIANEHYIDRVRCEFREEFMGYFKKDNLHLEIVISSEREDWIQSMIRDGVGVSTIPRYSLLHPELEHRPIVEPRLVRSVEFTILKQAETIPALSLLLNHVEGYEWCEPI